MKDNKGFSLVELLAVMVILGFIMSLAIVGYTRYRRKAIQDAYDILSQNASTAAEEYFMDHIATDSVTIETLVEEQYLNSASDPMFKGKNCNGTVEKFRVEKGTNESLDKVTNKVIVNCDKYDSCALYPNEMSCSVDGGIITDGENQSYSMGLANHNFGDNIALAIRVKFNELGKQIEYFGNWENSGGGLGVDGNNHFYFNMFSTSTNSFVAFNSNKVAFKNHWYVVVGSVEDGKLNLYVDGERLKTTSGASYVTMDGNIKVSPMEFLVGGNPQATGDGLRLAASITVTEAYVISKLESTDIANYFSTPNLSLNYHGSNALASKTF